MSEAVDIHDVFSILVVCENMIVTSLPDTSFLHFFACVSMFWSFVEFDYYRAPGSQQRILFYFFFFNNFLKVTVTLQNHAQNL